jgi:hypothetical protein
MRSIFNRITGSGKSCHCTVHPIGAYWLPSNRNHFERINEVPDIPEKLDGFLAVADYRRIPEHTAFAAKVAKIADRTGPGIDL